MDLHRTRWLVAILTATAGLCLVLSSYCTPDYLPACAAHPAVQRAPRLFLIVGVGLLALVCCCPALAVMPPRPLYEAAPWIEGPLRRKHARAMQAAAAAAEGV